MYENSFPSDAQHIYTFSAALNALVDGNRVQRAGWHGKGMYVYLWDDPAGVLRPCFILRTPDGGLQPGWLPSTADLLAGDWAMD